MRRLLLLVALVTGSAARADGPGPERPEPRPASAERSLPFDTTHPRPSRRVMGGPDYVGSDYGLGKPAFYGLGSRPDWGRGNTD